MFRLGTLLNLNLVPTNFEEVLHAVENIRQQGRNHQSASRIYFAKIQTSHERFSSVTIYHGRNGLSYIYLDPHNDAASSKQFKDDGDSALRKSRMTNSGSVRRSLSRRSAQSAPNFLRKSHDERGSTGSAITSASRFLRRKSVKLVNLVTKGNAKSSKDDDDFVRTPDIILALPYQGKKMLFLNTMFFTIVNF